MKEYIVTVTKVGSINLHAENAEEAMKMAEGSSEDQMYWESVTATDTNEIED